MLPVIIDVLIYGLYWICRISVVRITRGMHSHSPFFSANMKFPKRERLIQFTLNIEDIQIAPNALMAMEGEYVSIEYTSVVEKMALKWSWKAGF